MNLYKSTIAIVAMRWRPQKRTWYPSASITRMPAAGTLSQSCNLM